MRRLLATLLLLAGVPAAAQNTPTVTAHAEPDSILIGDRFDLVIDVEKDLVQVVEFPEFEDRDGKIEVVESLPVDTLERDGRRLKLRKRYRLAAFDEGRYNLGTARVLYADKNILDTLSSRDSVYLEVTTFQIDSTSQSIYDLKGQRTLPFRFREIRGYVLGACWRSRCWPPRPTPSTAGSRPAANGSATCSNPPRRCRRTSRPSRRSKRLHNQKTVAEQPPQTVLFGTDGHPAHLHRGALGHRSDGDDLRRDHRRDARGGTSGQGPHGPHGDPARRRSGEIRQATPPAEENEADYLKAYYLSRRPNPSRRRPRPERRTRRKTKPRQRCRSHSIRSCSCSRPPRPERSRCPNVRWSAKATGSTPRAITRSRSAVTSRHSKPSGTVRGHLRPRQRPTRPNASTAPNRPSGRPPPTRCVRRRSWPKPITIWATRSSSSRSTRRRSKATSNRCG